MTRRQWLQVVIGWDGCCPLIVVSSPEVFMLCFSKEVAGAATIALLLIMTLFRASRGERQIMRCSGGNLTLGRQFLFAGAVVMLLLFEGLTVAALFAGNQFVEVWLIAGLMYLGYLGLVVPALWPSRWTDPRPLVSTDFMIQESEDDP